MVTDYYTAADSKQETWETTRSRKGRGVQLGCCINGTDRDVGTCVVVDAAAAVCCGKMCCCLWLTPCVCMGLLLCERLEF